MPVNQTSPEGDDDNDLASRGCTNRLVVPYHSRLDTLSDNARAWLEKTCERFAEGEGYDHNPEAIRECLDAELITKPKHSRYIEVDAGVMGEVYSEGYFRHNAELMHPPSITPNQQQTPSGLHEATGSLLGFRWSVSIETQPPFAGYVDWAMDDDDNDEIGVRYHTLDDLSTGWREVKSLRPLVTDQDWRDLKAAIHQHKIEMAQKFLSENV